MEEHRLRERVVFRSSIEIDTEDGNRLFEDLENISMNGFFIKNIAPFEKEKEYDFDLKLTCGSKAINIIGKCTPRRFVSKEEEEETPERHKGVGFKITYLEPESSEELYHVVTYNTVD
jgi:hypothetical protein